MSLHHPASGMSESPSDKGRKPNSCLHNNHNTEQLSGRLVKSNEILTEVAPQILAAKIRERMLDTSILSKKSKKTKEQKSREGECDEYE